MTIADQLNSIANTKTAIKNAIIAKGVDMSGNIPFASYPSKIASISTSGGGGGGGTTLNAPFADLSLAVVVDIVEAVDNGEIVLTQTVPTLTFSLVVG